MLQRAGRINLNLTSRQDVGLASATMFSQRTRSSMQHSPNCSHVATEPPNVAVLDFTPFERMDHGRKAVG